MPFWSENGYRLCPFWPGIGCGFRGNYGSVWAYLLFQFQMGKKEREICEFEMDLIVCFGLVWKRVRKITYFGVKSGQDLGGTPPGRIPGSTPPPPRGYTVNSISADTFRKWIPKDGPCFSSVCSSYYPLGVPSLRRIVLTVEGNSNINKTIAFTYLERIEGKLFPDMKVMIVFVSHNTCLTSSEVAVMCCPWHWLRYA